MKLLLFLSMAALVLCVQGQSLVVGTYNLRNDNSSDVANGNGWQRRAPVVCRLIEFHDFDLLGTQELLHNQVEDLLKGLPEYAYVGVGRDDGATQGEYSAIFYKKERFQLLRNGNFWLAEDETHPNKGWDAACIRICSWAYLKDKQTGRQIWMFNLHMDHIGVEARKQSVLLIFKKIKTMCGTEPVILSGDFNIDQTNAGYQLLATSGILFDAYQKARFRYLPNGTFNDFKGTQVSNSRIDHLFVSSHFDVDRYGVLTDTYRTSAVGDKDYHLDNESQPSFEEQGVVRTPSDHFPVKIILNYRK